MLLLHCERDANGVPHLRDRQIDRDAEMMVRDYKPSVLQTPQQFDIEVFVEEYLRLNLQFENLSNSGFIWGCMVFDNIKIPVFLPEQNRAMDCPIDADTIVVDNQRLCDETAHTCRSTIAHESGHWVYHKPIFKLTTIRGRVANRAKGFTTCNRNNVSSRSGRRSLVTESDWIEHHAKYFGSALLMPKPSMEMLCRDPSTERRVNAWLLNDSASERNHALTTLISETYGVSRTAARIRIEQLGLSYQPSADELKRRQTCWQPDGEMVTNRYQEPDLDAQIEAYYERLYRRAYC